MWLYHRYDIYNLKIGFYTSVVFITKKKIVANRYILLKAALGLWLNNVDPIRGVWILLKSLIARLRVRAFKYIVINNYGLCGSNYS